MVWRKLTQEHLEQTKQHFAAQGYVMQWFAMASEVILTTLGPDWWKENCVTSASAADPFLEIKDESDSGRYEYQDRIVQLGHMLYALKEVEGYDAFISSLASRELEPAFFELWVANALKRSGYEITFVERKGIKGRDYDLIAHKESNTICVEAKSRRYQDVLNEAVLSNALRKARKQLPASGPAAIFVLISPQWARTSNSEAITSGCIDTFLRNTRRVNYVVIAWHTWIPLEIGRGSTYIVRQFNNPSPRIGLELGSIITPVGEPVIMDPNRQTFKPSFW